MMSKSLHTIMSPKSFLPSSSSQVRIFMYFYNVRIFFPCFNFHFHSSDAFPSPSFLFLISFRSMLPSLFVTPSLQRVNSYPFTIGPSFYYFFSPFSKFLHSHILRNAKFFPSRYFSCNFPLTVNIFSFFLLANHFPVHFSCVIFFFFSYTYIYVG